MLKIIPMEMSMVSKRSFLPLIPARAEKNGTSKALTVFKTSEFYDAKRQGCHYVLVAAFASSRYRQELRDLCLQ